MQFTDTHLFGDAERALRGVPSLPALKAALAAARNDIEEAAAILATGDLVQDDPAGYAHFRTTFSGLQKPVLCVPGNHDDSAALRLALERAPFQVGGHFDCGRWRIVLVDSSVPGEVEGRLSAEDLAGIRSALQGMRVASRPEHALIALHHHPLPLNSRWLDNIGLSNADELLSLIEEFPQVRGVVFGHVHQAFDGERAGVRYMGTPSTCAQFRPRLDEFAVDEKPPAWRLLKLYANGAIESTVQWLHKSVVVRRCA